MSSVRVHSYQDSIRTHLLIVLELIVDMKWEKLYDSQKLEKPFDL